MNLFTVYLDPGLKYTCCFNLTYIPSEALQANTYGGRELPMKNSNIFVQ